MNASATPKILVVVPSYKRVGTLAKYTYSWLSAIGVDYRIFVRPDQLPGYQGFRNIQPLPANKPGLGYALVQAKQYAQANGYTHIFKIDDDVRKFVRFRERNAENSLAQAVTVFSQLYTDVMQLLMEGYQCISFPYRNQFYSAKDDVLPYQGRVQTCYVVATELYNPDERISTLEDFNCQLEVYKQQAKYCQLYKYGIDLGNAVFTGAGGLQSYDRVQMNQAEIAVLQEKYPFAAFKVKHIKSINSDYQEVDFAKTKRNLKAQLAGD